MIALAPLALIPFASILNHLRGQNGALPDSRITYTVLMGAAYGAAAWLVGIPFDRCVMLACASALGLVFWAVFAWGRGFTCITGNVESLLYGDSHKPSWLDKGTDAIYFRLYREAPPPILGTSERSGE